MIQNILLCSILITKAMMNDGSETNNASKTSNCSESYVVDVRLSAFRINYINQHLVWNAKGEIIPLCTVPLTIQVVLTPLLEMEKNNVAFIKNIVPYLQAVIHNNTIKDITNNYVHAILVQVRLASADICSPASLKWMDDNLIRPYRAINFFYSLGGTEEDLIKQNNVSFVLTSDNSTPGKYPIKATIVRRHDKPATVSFLDNPIDIPESFTCEFKDHVSYDKPLKCDFLPTRIKSSSPALSA